MVVGVILISGTMDTGVLVLVGAILSMVADITVHLFMEGIIIRVINMVTDNDMEMAMLIIEEEEILVMQQEETLTLLIEQLAAQEML